MKFLPATIAEIVRLQAPQKQNVRLLLRFLGALAGLILAYNAARATHERNLDTLYRAGAEFDSCARLLSAAPAPGCNLS